MVSEEDPGAAGVLGGDEVDFFQDSKGPEGEVLQVADGGRHDIEAPSHATSPNDVTRRGR